MPRIRYIKPTFFSDGDLCDLPPLTRLFYAGLWCYVNRDGIALDRPRELKALILPYDEADGDQMLAELAKPKPGRPHGFIVRYEVKGERYIRVVKWGDHQKPHPTERAGTYPPAPEFSVREPVDNGEKQSRDGEVKGKNQSPRSRWATKRDETKREENEQSPAPVHRDEFADGDDEESSQLNLVMELRRKLDEGLEENRALARELEAMRKKLAGAQG